jgi:hypothetical protein
MAEIYLQPGSDRVNYFDIDNFTYMVIADDIGYEITIYQDKWVIVHHIVPYTGDTAGDLKNVEIYCKAFIQDYIDKLQYKLDNLEVKW